MRPMIAACMMLSACSSIQPSDKAAVDYNRAFARARDEVHVLNVLRASQQQPLQFSTISTVHGAVKSGASIKLPFTNIIAGGADSISPELTITNRNPLVTILPLASKEFVLGVSQPIAPSTIDHLLNQGWKREVVLPLVIRGVVCGNRVFINEGEDKDLDAAFGDVFRAAENFGVSEMGANEDKPVATLRMQGKDAMTFIKDGVGTGREIRSVSAVKDDPAQVELAVHKTKKVAFVGLKLDTICTTKAATLTSENAETNITGYFPAGQNGVITRSVQNIFRYLGNLHRHNLAAQLESCSLPEGGEDVPKAGLFILRHNCEATSAPPYSVVSTTFQDRIFYVPPIRRTNPGDNTLEALSVLSQLIDLQTNEASLRTSTPFVAIAQ